MIRLGFAKKDMPLKFACFSALTAANSKSVEEIARLHS